VGCGIHAASEYVVDYRSIHFALKLVRGCSCTTVQGEVAACSCCSQLDAGKMKVEGRMKNVDEEAGVG